MESLVGRKLGKYELTAMIGGGGMATVYEARHPGLDQRVAVKILHPFLSTDRSFIDRFRREAHAVAALRHPNIVRVLDFDHDDQLYYMVMEYIGGPTMSSVLSARRGVGGLSLPEVRRIFPPLCSAVDYAASRGMVHRDIKPANIILSEDGEPILTDYGIAKMVGSTSLTSPGTVVGSAHYMSPEQAQGYECDIRSDLYSLGIVLFEALSGAVPFDADTTVTVLLKQISAPIPSIRALRPNLPPAIDVMLARALAKQPQDRYEMGATFAEELLVALAPTKSVPAVTELVTPVTPPADMAAPPEIMQPAVSVADGGPAAGAAVGAADVSPVETMPAFPAETTPQGQSTLVETPVAMASVPAGIGELGVVPPGTVAAQTGESRTAEPEAKVSAEADASLAAVPSSPASPSTPAPQPPLIPPMPAGGATRLETARAETLATPVGREEAVAGSDTPASPVTEAAEPAAGVEVAEPRPVRESTDSADGDRVLNMGQKSVPVPEFTPLAASQGQGSWRNRKRLVIVAVAALVVVAAIAIGTWLGLSAGGPDSNLNVTTTTISTTSSGITTSTTMLTTSTSALTTTSGSTTTVKPTTTTVKPTTTTAKPTTTVRRTTTTRRPTTTQTTSPPNTIGPGTTNPPDTIGPG